MIKPQCNLSLVILANNETENLAALLPQVHSALDPLDAVYEIIIVDNHASEYACEVMQQNRCRLLCPSTPGYGGALVAGIQQATGDYIIVMSADLAHPAAFLRDLWTARDTADVVIASRYISMVKQ
jgi:dolichol-phosphate mannosyltransferase